MEIGDHYLKKDLPPDKTDLPPDKIDIPPDKPKILKNIIISKSSDQAPNQNTNSMEFDESNFSISSTDDDHKTVNYKRKRTDVEIDLSSFNYVNKPQSSPVINTQNRFAILGEMNIEEEPSTSRKSTTAEKEFNKISPSNKLFCSPIFLFNVNIKKLVEQLNSKNVVYKIINKNKQKSKLYLKDAEAHSEMMQLLRDKKIESYSYTPKELKRISIVLRGLYYKTELNEIKNELDLLVPNTVDSVSKFSTNYSRKNNIDTGLFLITLFIGKKN